MNVPKLRFKEFTDEWVTCTINSVAEVISGGTPDTTNSNYWDGSINWFTPSEVGKSKYISNSKRKITQLGLQKSSAKLLPVGTILLSSRATVGESSILYNNEACTNQGFQSLIPHKNINNEFLYYLIYKYKKSLLKQAFGSTFLEISKNNVEKIKINIPTAMKEQVKLSTFLSLLDRKIELQTKKIEVLKLFKKGLFDTQLKNNEKESIMFDDFLDEATEKSSIQNQYPVLSSTSKGLFLQSDYFNKQASSENNVGYKILKRNQLVLSPQNLWMGNININNIFDIGIVSPSYRVYNIDIKKIDLNYFNYWIKTPKALYSYLISSEQGASIVRRNLNIEMFNQISLKIPDLEKQHIIGNRIYQFYLKINLEEEKLKLLYKLKKGLMQNMFI